MERTPQARPTRRRALELGLMHITQELDELRVEARESGDKKIAEDKPPWLRHGSIEATVMHAMDLSGCAGILRAEIDHIAATTGESRFAERNPDG